MTTWLLAYGNRFLKTEKILYDMVVTKKDNRIWIGFESILSLVFIRFRPGGKFRFKKGFKIGTDHSHEFKIGDYLFNMQGFKRSLLGGNSMDLLNFITPLYYCNNILTHPDLKEENKTILIKIARESIQSLLCTYDKDILANDALKRCDLILKTIENGDELENLKDVLCIADNYIDNPLTVKNHELWCEHMDILNRICSLFIVAYNDIQKGKNPENYLDEIKNLQESIREKLEKYLMEIPHGQS